MQRRLGPEGDSDQIQIKEAPYRQLLEMRVACHSEEDLATIRGNLDGIGVAYETQGRRLVVPDPTNKWTVTIEPQEVRDVPEPAPRIMNRPGNRPLIGAGASCELGLGERWARLTNRG